MTYNKEQGGTAKLSLMKSDVCLHANMDTMSSISLDKECYHDIKIEWVYQHDDETGAIEAVYLI